MERRSFFAVLAAPLFRRFLPAKPELPVASVPIMGSGALAMVHNHESVLPPLTVESLKAALYEFQRIKEATGDPISLPDGAMVRWNFPKGSRWDS